MRYCLIAFLFFFSSTYTLAQKANIDTLFKKNDWKTKKEEMKKLLACNCIDKHIEHLVNKQDSTSEFVSPLSFPFLFYNSNLCIFKYSSVYQIVDSFENNVIITAINKNSNSEDANSSFLNIYSWCHHTAEKYIRKNWLVIRKILEIKE